LTAATEVDKYVGAGAGAVWGTARLVILVELEEVVKEGMRSSWVKVGAKLEEDGEEEVVLIMLIVFKVVEEVGESESKSATVMVSEVNRDDEADARIWPMLATVLLVVARCEEGAFGLTCVV
jgi:hypothetical protein